MIVNILGDRNADILTEIQNDVVFPDTAQSQFFSLC